MAFDQREEFFGQGRTMARARRKGWTEAAIAVGVGLIFASIWWWAPASEPSYQRPDPVLALLAFAAPCVGVGMVVYGLVQVRRLLRAVAVPETEQLWYALDAQGLHLLHDVDLPRVISWDAIRQPVLYPAAPGLVRFRHRPPGSVIDRTIVIRSGQRSRNGALFEDQLMQWHAAKASHAVADDPSPIRSGDAKSAMISIWRDMGTRKRIAYSTALGAFVITAMGSQLSKGPPALAQDEPAAREATHRAKFMINANEAGVGFLTSDGAAQGFLNCRPSGDDRPTQIALEVGRFENAKVQVLDGYWMVDDVRVPMALELRIDGKAFTVRDTRLSPSLGGPALIGGWLDYSGGLHKALGQARSIELVSGDRVIGISTAGRHELTALARTCRQIARSSDQ